MKDWTQNLRGVNTKLMKPGYKDRPAEFITKETVEKLSSWNVNCIRVGICADYGYTDTPVDILDPYKLHFDYLGKLIRWTKDKNINIIVSADKLYNRKNNWNLGIRQPILYLDTLIVLWKKIANWFGHNKHLIGYDIFNEPKYELGNNDWQNIMIPTLIKTIRDIDKETALVIEPARSEAWAFWQPFNDPKCVYSYHEYNPRWFTSQGTTDTLKITNKAYEPGMATIPQLISNFSSMHNVPIFVGEFGCVRYANNPQDFFNDFTGLIEDKGWSACNHSYAAHDDWNSTFSKEYDNADHWGVDGGVETPQLLELKNWWAKNTI